MRKLKLFLSCVVTMSSTFSAGLSDRICALYPEDVKPIVHKVLQQSLQQDRSEFGTSFPPNSQWLNILESIAEGDRIANLGAGAPELSVLCALKGAVIDMVDKRDDAADLWRLRVSSLEQSLTTQQVEKLRANYSAKVLCQNKDCLEFLRSAEASSYKQIICENLLHFFSDEQQSIMSSEVLRVLAPNAVFSVIVDRLPDTVENPTNANTFWIGRAVIDIGDGQPTLTQPMIYESFDNPPFTNGLVREYRIQLSSITTEVKRLFPLQKREEYISTAAQYCRKNSIDYEDIFGVSIEPRRLYTTTTIMDSEFAKGLTLVATSSLSGFRIGSDLLVGYAVDDSYFLRAENMGAQKVAAIFRKSALN